MSVVIVLFIDFVQEKPDSTLSVTYQVPSNIPLVSVKEDAATPALFTARDSLNILA